MNLTFISEFGARTHVDQGAILIELPRLLGGTTLPGVQAEFKR